MHHLQRTGGGGGGGIIPAIFTVSVLILFLHQFPLYLPSTALAIDRSLSMLEEENQLFVDEVCVCYMVFAEERLRGGGRERGRMRRWESGRRGGSYALHCI